MLIGFVLVLVFNGVIVEPVTPDIMTLNECNAVLQVEKAYRPKSEYDCAAVYRDEKAPE